MRKKYDIVATVGKYTDRNTGEEKKRYQSCGAVFEDDKGRLSIKLDTIPITPEWSGWLSCFDPDRKNQGQSAPPRTQDDHNRAKSNGYQPQDDEQDDLQF